jgi:copper chaperone CopZ
MSEMRTYSVPDVHCDHCRAALVAELGPLDGVESVVVDLAARTVTVTGDALDDEAVRAAIDEAGYDVA